MSIFYAGELNPVAAKAQKKVPVPEGLDLEAWINEPPLESEDEAEEEEDDDEESHDDDGEDGYNELVQRMPSPSDKDKKKKKKTKKQKEKKRRKKSEEEEEEYDVEQARQNRLLEQSMNPNYLKVSPG